jgi:hypothetical protein
MLLTFNKHKGLIVLQLTQVNFHKLKKENVFLTSFLNSLVNACKQTPTIFRMNLPRAIGYVYKLNIIYCLVL